MNKVVLVAARQVSAEDLGTAQLGARFGRLDLLSQLSLLAVESLGVDFDQVSRDRTAICLAARAGSLSTDLEYWEGRDRAGGPSPTLFAYTLPSSALGEVAIRHRLRGPSLCWVGGNASLVNEGADLIRRGEAEACLCISVEVISARAAALMKAAPMALACALYLCGQGEGLVIENDRDTEAWWALFYAEKYAS